MRSGGNPVFTIKTATSIAMEKLSSTSDTAQLDAEILILHALRQDKAYLYAHSEEKLSPEQLQQFDQLIEQRKQGFPIAYLTGTREFWSLPLKITPDVLIPRPETELLVETALAAPLKLCSTGSSINVADLGTGSGAIAIALATERPDWQITATDQSAQALALAKENAATHHCANIEFRTGSWYKALPNDTKFDMIISNPPYIGKSEPELQQGDVRFEPQDALVAEDNGLADITIIIQQAHHYLKPHGWLLLEHGYQQAEAVAKLLKTHGFHNIQHQPDLAGHIRVTIGKV